MIELEFAGETVDATANHPVWAVSGVGLACRPPVSELPVADSLRSRAGRWVEAAHLKPGDTVLTLTQGTATVSSVRSRPDRRPVYNFEVSGAHTYTVASAGLLVHNMCAGQLPRSAQRGIRSYERRIAEHEKKIAEFKANPTVKPGMEGMSQEVIAAQQQNRIRHWEDEIKAFKKNIDDLRRGGQ